MIHIQSGKWKLCDAQKSSHLYIPLLCIIICYHVGNRQLLPHFPQYCLSKQLATCRGHPILQIIQFYNLNENHTPYSDYDHAFVYILSSQDKYFLRIGYIFLEKLESEFSPLENWIIKSTTPFSEISEKLPDKLPICYRRMRLK